MFTLVKDRSKYFRVKRGQTAERIESELNTPAPSVFAGAIIAVGESGLCRYVADVGDTYRRMALKFGTDGERLKEINGFKRVYPTCKLFVPSK